MGMSSDPIESAAKGAVKGVLEWGEDFIKKLVIRFREKEVSFVEDEDTLKIVREQYDSGELQVYKHYLTDRNKLK